MAEKLKPTETRPKPSPWRCGIGELVALHASVRHPQPLECVHGMLMIEATGDQLTYRVPLLRQLSEPAEFVDLALPLGAIVAAGVLVDVVPIGLPEFTDPRVRFDAYGDFTPGRSALIFENVVKLRRPVFDVGGHHQGLWRLPVDAEAAVLEQIASAA